MAHAQVDVSEEAAQATSPSEFAYNQSNWVLRDRWTLVVGVAVVVDVGDAYAILIAARRRLRVEDETTGSGEGDVGTWSKSRKLSALSISPWLSVSALVRDSEYGVPVE